MALQTGHILRLLLQATQQTACPQGVAMQSMALSKQIIPKILKKTIRKSGEKICRVKHYDFPRFTR